MARLRFFTEDGLPEVYPVLAARQDSAGRTGCRSAFPSAPTARRAGCSTRCSARSTSCARGSSSIAASCGDAVQEGKKIWSARVGIGKSGTPTPRGQFWIRERLKGLGGSSVYGPWAFGTSAYSNLSDWPGGGVVGIHGTNQPGLIPGRPSHGCIRVKTTRSAQLARLMPIGTPVSIIN